jgi:hypothetical protein
MAEVNFEANSLRPVLDWPLPADREAPASIVYDGRVSAFCAGASSPMQTRSDAALARCFDGPQPGDGRVYRRRDLHDDRQSVSARVHGWPRPIDSLQPPDPRGPQSYDDA